MTDAADPLISADVLRGVSRMLYRHDFLSVPEVSLRNNRRADIMAIGPRGELTIIEIKVSRADLLGDGKWPEYLEFCDRYFWAVPQGFDLTLFERDQLCPDITGLIVADRYDAAIIREAPVRPLAAARRKTETLRLARLATRRMLSLSAIFDIDLGDG